jgi:hypothetical protein
MWAYRTSIQTGCMAPPRCLNQYNPGVSKPNNPNQMHEHTKISLPAISNMGPSQPNSSPASSLMLLNSSRAFTLLHVGPWRHFPCGLDRGTCKLHHFLFKSLEISASSQFGPWPIWSHVHFVSWLLLGFMIVSRGAWWTLPKSLAFCVKILHKK